MKASQASLSQTTRRTDTISLTKKERAYINKGGRVFVVEKIDGPLWRVLSVSKTGIEVLLKPEGAEGYSDESQARNNALMIATLSVDKPLVQPFNILNQELLHDSEKN